MRLSLNSKRLDRNILPIEKGTFFLLGNFCLPEIWVKKSIKIAEL